MKPSIHAASSVRKFGGKPEDYLKIHDWFDQTKSHFGDNRHRAILHSSFGIFLAEQMFGHNIKNSDGREVSVRDIGEQHVMEDMKFIPTVADYLSEMEYQNWMHGKGVPASYKKIQDKITANKKGSVFIPFEEKPEPAPAPKVRYPRKPMMIDGSGIFFQEMKNEVPVSGKVTPVSPLPEPPPRLNEDAVYDGSGYTRESLLGLPPVVDDAAFNQELEKLDAEIDGYEPQMIVD